MYSEVAEDFRDYLDWVVGDDATSKNFVLYRGQSQPFPLLPSIARAKQGLNTLAKEKRMLDQLKRRSRTVISKNFNDDWDWLVYAQHFGMRTRLLDWTSNPLVALWFAATEALRNGTDAFVYLLGVENNMILDKKLYPTPWIIKHTQVFKPDLNNERILAQAGWFTAHCYSTTSSQWIDLKKHKVHGSKITEFKIPKAKLKNCLIELNTLGINYQSLFPDAEGVCKHINWLATHGKLAY